MPETAQSSPAAPHRRVSPSLPPSPVLVFDETSCDRLFSDWWRSQAHGEAHLASDHQGCRVGCPPNQPWGLRHAVQPGGQ